MNNQDDISKYDLIKGGTNNLERKWGFHCEEVQRQLKSGKITEEEAKKMNGGWSVSGQGGALEPFDKDKVDYKNKKWWQEVDF